jgi:AAA+ ATPase superfamily predicted ATPase
MDLISLSKELLKQDIIPRERYYKELDDTIKTNQVTVIQGQRRVGKSYTVL